jgi:hypothetical protein
MTFWEFVVRSEWPIVVGGALFVFREPIKQLLESVTKLKVSGPGFHGELEAAVRKQARLGDAVVDQVLPLISDPGVRDTLKKFEAANNEVRSIVSAKLSVTESPDNSS